MKRSIKVPAISNKLADIPPDEYSWRKYGQKPIKGSPHPRYGFIYHLNSIVRSCSFVRRSRYVNFALLMVCWSWVRCFFGCVVQNSVLIFIPLF